MVRPRETKLFLNPFSKFYVIKRTIWTLELEIEGRGEPRYHPAGLLGKFNYKGGANGRFIHRGTKGHNPFY